MRTVDILTTGSAQVHIHPPSYVPIIWQPVKPIRHITYLSSKQIQSLPKHAVGA